MYTRQAGAKAQVGKVFLSFLLVWSPSPLSQGRLLGTKLSVVNEHRSFKEGSNSLTLNHVPLTATFSLKSLLNPLPAYSLFSLL